MAKQEKSYSDWKDEGAHLTKEQWNAAGDFLLQGESSTNAIEMAEKLVLPPRRKEMCEFLSEDYALRASNRGMDYKKSYDSYMKRTEAWITRSPMRVICSDHRIEALKIYLNILHQSKSFLLLLKLIEQRSI